MKGEYSAPVLIIGITGAIGHGKSSLASFLVGFEPNTSKQIEAFHVISEVADKLNQSTKVLPNPDKVAEVKDWLSALPEILSNVLGVEVYSKKIEINEDDYLKRTSDYIKLRQYLSDVNRQPGLLAEPISDKNKASYRAILQWLGGYLVKSVNDGIWYKEILERIKGLSLTGTHLFAVGGVRFPSDAEYIRTAGGIIIEIVRPSVSALDEKDPTEKQRNLIIADSVIINDGDLNNLKSCASRMIEDVRSQKLRKEYHAAQFGP